jgi:hypothetical protein
MRLSMLILGFVAIPWSPPDAESPPVRFTVIENRLSVAVLLTGIALSLMVILAFAAAYHQGRL